MDEHPQIIDGTYKVLRPLGGGGFSEVFLVEGAKGSCALKLLKGGLVAMKKDALEEFRHEFEILKDMRHPHIAGILDFGFDEAAGRYYYTSEFIEGIDFTKATDGMPVERVTDLVVEALRALEYLHSYRIHHFDIKGANVLVVGGETPTVKIIDFGLAGFDPHGRIIGTPSYMAPEIAARDPADRRADLYSLGVLWYASLAHVNPFRGGSTQETLARQLSLMPPPPSQRNEQVPAWIDAIIMRLLEKNPANRYASAEAVIRDIGRQGPKRYQVETRETLLSYLPDEGRFIGRVEEMAKLERAAEAVRLAEKGLAKSWFVGGPMGSGRSRLLKELKYRLQLRDLHVRLASCADAEGALAWSEALAAHLAGGKGASVWLLDDVDRAEENEALAGRIVSALYAARRPAPEARALVVLAAGDPAGAGIPELAGVADGRIDLANFSPGELRGYLTSLTGLEDPPAELLEGIHRRTEGNPYFVTEFIRSLIAGGGLFDEHGRWKATLFEDLGVDFSKAILSDTVNDLLVSRVAGLPAADRQLLEALAVADAPATAAELAAWTAIADAHTRLHALMLARVLDRAENFAFSFRNALLGPALADRLSPERRAALHDAIAGALAAVGAPVERVLHHRSFGSDRAEALAAAVQLGEAALGRGLARQARERFGRALALVEQGDAERQVAVQMKLGEAALIGHDYDEARRRFAVVEGMVAKDAGNARAASWRADALIRLGGTAIKLSEPGRARVALQDARAALAAAGGDLRRELVIDNFLAGLLFQDGRADEARRMFEQTREAWLRLPREERAQVTNNDLGTVLVATGDLPAAAAILMDDLARADDLGDDLLVGRAHYNLAQLALAQRDYTAAAEAYRRCADVCRRSENTELLLRAYNGLGNAFQLAGDAAKSLTYYERGLELHERVGDLRGGAAIAVNMGIVETARGDFDAAENRLVPAIEYLRRLETKTAVDWLSLARGLLELGDVRHRTRREQKARAALEEAEAIAAHVPKAAPLRFWILATLAEVAIATGDAREARQLVEKMRPLAAREDEAAKLAELEAGARGVAPSSEEKPSVSAAPAFAPEPAPPPVQEARRAPAGSRAWRRILEINKLIAAEADVDYVLKTVLFYALELAHAEAGAILLLDGAGQLAVASARNMAGDPAEQAFSRTLAERAIAGGKAVVTDDAMADARFQQEASVAAHSLRSILCLPVRARGRVIGALYLDHRFQPGAFAGADLELLDAYADQVGLAIETSRLLAAQVRKEEDLKVELSEASRRVERYEELLEARGAEEAPDLGPLVGKSAAMARVLRTVAKIAETDLAVFLCGETGTGKELIARALHGHHPERCKARFVAINCGAIPATLIESELFGYKAGAFTGASRDKRGLIEEADGGTLFLDEITELDPALQVKLLRVLQEKECVRLGATEAKRVDVRVVAASNRDVEALVKAGGFREDLYYRLCQMRIDLPPLRERPEDLAALARRFVAEAAPGRDLAIGPRLMRRLVAYPWPGNVRELKNLMEVAAALAEGPTIDDRAIPENHPIARLAPPAGKAAWPPPEKPVAAPARERRPAPQVLSRPMIDEANRYDEGKSWKDYERVIAAKCFAANNFRAKPAAAELGISVATLYSRINEWGLSDRGNESYADPFVYARGTTLEQYLPKVFAAALAAAGNRPSVAIANLRVSQGYFYKVMKKAKR